QRRALNLRDKGCIKCGRPPQWCQAHHIQHWIDGGPTNLDNLCLLCSECHRLVHHADWRIQTTKNGRPECVQPDWFPMTA
ncbi:MAG: HNH endonuclease, partial [Bradyrhizobiaceae bacterium]|nr:HNH endonuclease [Bradyrhizobiaceae bacterium]